MIDGGLLPEVQAPLAVEAREESILPEKCIHEFGLTRVDQHPLTRRAVKDAAPYGQRLKEIHVGASDQDARAVMPRVIEEVLHNIIHVFIPGTKKHDFA